MHSSGKHSLFLYTLTDFDAISHIAVILSRTNIMKIRQGSGISFARYGRGNVWRYSWNRGIPARYFSLAHAFTPRQPSSQPGLLYLSLVCILGNGWLPYT
jgi:hypothetical protein